MTTSEGNIKLIHHTAASISGGVSPFSDAVAEIVEAEEVRIACPYIGIEYITGLLAGCPSWRILTDAEEFICCNKGAQREATVEFIAAHPERIRHIKDLHAKVVSGGDKALVGSANLTRMGLTARDEMAVIFDGTEQVRELERWFDDLWASGAELLAADLERFVASIPESVDAPDLLAFHLPSSARRVRAAIEPARDSAGSDLDARVRLITKLRQAPHRDWADHYLDLVRELVEVAGLDDDDPRLVMSLPQGPRLPVTICQRYALAAFWKGRSVLSMMLPKDRGIPTDLRERVVRWGGGFKPVKGETDESAPYWVSFNVPDPAIIPERVKDEWRTLIRLEPEHGRYSSFKKFHEPIVFRAATDRRFRRELLDEAFEGEGA